MLADFTLCKFAKMILDPFQGTQRTAWRRLASSSDQPALPRDGAGVSGATLCLGVIGGGPTGVCGAQLSLGVIGGRPKGVAGAGFSLGVWGAPVIATLGAGVGGATNPPVATRRTDGVGGARLGADRYRLVLLSGGLSSFFLGTSESSRLPLPSLIRKATLSRGAKLLEWLLFRLSGWRLLEAGRELLRRAMESG